MSALLFSRGLAHAKYCGFWGLQWHSPVLWSISVPTEVYHQSGYLRKALNFLSVWNTKVPPKRIQGLVTNSLMTFPSLTDGDGMSLYATGSLWKRSLKQLRTLSEPKPRWWSWWLCAWVWDVGLQLMTTWVFDSHHTEEAHKLQCLEHGVEPVLTAALLLASKRCHQLVPVYLHGMPSYQHGMSLLLPKNQKVKVLKLGYI